MQKFKILRQTLDLAEEEQLLEKLKASDPTGKWVSDFVHSDNPKFAGKSKKERIKMALGASYAAKRAEGKIKEEAELYEEMSHSELAQHHFDQAKKYYAKSDKYENEGNNVDADHFGEVGLKHALAYHAHKDAAESGKPEDSKEAHKASKEANGMDVSESVELDESKHTLGNVLPKGEQINDRIQKHMDAADFHRDQARKVDAKDPKDIEGYNRHASLTDLHAKAFWSLRHHKKSPNGNHLKDYVATHKRIQDRYKKDPQLTKEEVEHLDEISLKDRLAGKTAPVVKSKYNRSKANRPMTAKELEAHNRSKALDHAKMPAPDHAKDYTIKHKSSHTEEGELEDATYHNYDILHKGKKVGTHHFADYFGHGTTTIHGHKEYDTGYVGNTERLHHYMKSKKGFRNVFGKKEGEQKHADYVAKHGIKKYATEEVEHLDEISAGLAKKVAQARDKSAVANRLTPTQSRRLKMKDSGGEPFMNAAQALKSAMKRGAKNVYGEEVEHLDELSKKTLGSYINKAARGARMAGQTARDFDRHAKSARKPEYKAGAGELSQQYLQKAWKREDGIKAAVSKLTKEEVENKLGIHKVSVTINDKDKDDKDMKIEKMLKVKANNQAAALAIAKKHYGGKGYKVHNASYHGIHEEGRLSSGAKDPCWKNYEMVGTKKKNGREVPNCVPKKKD